MRTIIINYKSVVNEDSYNSSDHDLAIFQDTPIAVFEEKVSDAKINEYMLALNPKIKYVITWAAVQKEVIGYEEVDKYILLNEKKAEVKRLQEEIEEMDKNVQLHR